LIAYGVEVGYCANWYMKDFLTFHFPRANRSFLCLIPKLQTVYMVNDAKSNCLLTQKIKLSWEAVESILLLFTPHRCDRILHVHDQSITIASISKEYKETWNLQLYDPEENKYKPSGMSKYSCMPCQMVDWWLSFWTCAIFFAL
jgi:hypothetical protein